MDKHGKIWGITQNLISKDTFSIHRLEIKKDSYCSKHVHVNKYNKFYVESGSIKIKIWKNDYDLLDEITLNAGDSTTVNPGEYHQFESIENSIVYEIYWVSLCESDIIRKDVGGTTKI